MGITARTAAELMGIHRNTAVRFFHRLREKIVRKQQGRIDQFCGNIELYESYFDGCRAGNCGIGAGGERAYY